MRRGATKIKKPQHYDLTPWGQPENSQRQQTKHAWFSQMSLHSDNPSDEKQVFTILRKAAKKHSLTSQVKVSNPQRRSPEPAVYGKTLSFVKDYLKKNYSEKDQLIEQKVQPPPPKRRQRSVKTEGAVPISFGKASIVDLSSSFADFYQVPQRSRISGQYTTLKVLRLRQKLLKSKQLEKKPSKQLVIKDDNSADLQRSPVQLTRRRCSTAVKDKRSRLTKREDEPWSCLQITSSACI